MLLRVLLPDRPGSLGAVASAMGQVGADILAIEIVEKNGGAAIDDFMVSLPPHVLPDSLVSACASIEGCEVLYLSHHQETWGIENDIETLNRMAEQPRNAAAILVEAAPTVFHSQWAALLDTSGPSVVVSTELAPEFDEPAISLLAPLDATHRIELAAGWMDAWPTTTAALAPLGENRAIVVGRQGGPAFLDSELNRLSHLAALA